VPAPSIVAIVAPSRGIVSAAVLCHNDERRNHFVTRPVIPLRSPGGA